MEKTIDLPTQRDTETGPEVKKQTEVLDALLEDTWLTDYFTDQKPTVT